MSGALFTCGRPGRILGSKLAKVSDNEVAEWVAGLPSGEGEVVIVSLLGSKPSGLSEFSYYSFRSTFERPQDQPGCPAFQEWLDTNFAPGRYRVCEHPTTDTFPIPDDTKAEVASSALSFLAAGKTVVIVDSGGCSRTGAIVRLIAARLNVKFSEQQLTTNCP